MLPSVATRMASGWTPPTSLCLELESQDGPLWEGLGNLLTFQQEK